MDTQKLYRDIDGLKPSIDVGNDPNLNPSLSEALRDAFSFKEVLGDLLNLQDRLQKSFEDRSITEQTLQNERVQRELESKQAEVTQAAFQELKAHSETACEKLDDSRRQLEEAIVGLEEQELKIQEFSLKVSSLEKQLKNEKNIKLSNIQEAYRMAEAEKMFNQKSAEYEQRYNSLQETSQILHERWENLNSDKMMLKEYSIKLYQELRAASVLHPLRDYQAIILMEQQKIEKQLRKLPESSIQRSVFENTMADLDDQLALLQSTIDHSKLELDARAEMIKSAMETSRMVISPPLPPGTLEALKV